MRIMKYLTSFFPFLVLNFVSAVYSVGTGQCNHNQTSENVMNLISCMDKVLDNHMDNLITEYKTQFKDNSKTYDVTTVKDNLVKLYDDVSTCVVEFSGKCFEEKVVNLVKTFVDSIKPILQDTSKVEESLKLEKFMAELKTVVGEGDDAIGKFIEKTLTSDKKCTPDKIEETTEKEILRPCLAPQISTLAPYYYYVDETKDESNMPLQKEFPDTVSVCQTMDSMMNSCMKETDCLSTQEMTFLKSVGVVVYQMVLDKAAKIKKQFGTMDEMIKTLKETTFKYGSETVTGDKILTEFDDAFSNKEKQGRLLKSLDSLFDDYNGDNCKSKVAALTKQLPAAAAVRPAKIDESGSNQKMIAYGILVSMPLFTLMCR